MILPRLMTEFIELKALKPSLLDRVSVLRVLPRVLQCSPSVSQGGCNKLPNDYTQYEHGPLWTMPHQSVTKTLYVPQPGLSSYSKC